jgi:hypothetical protein
MKPKDEMNPGIQGGNTNSAICSCPHCSRFSVPLGPKCNTDFSENEGEGGDCPKAVVPCLVEFLKGVFCLVRRLIVFGESEKSSTRPPERDANDEILEPAILGTRERRHTA